MTETTIPNFFINAFYESKFQGNLFVIKASGKVIEDDEARDALIRNIHQLTLHGVQVLLIYGGGRAMDEQAHARGIEVTNHDGRRVTDLATIEMMKEVVGGSLSLKVYQSMAAQNVEGLSLNAVPSSWMEVELRPKAPIDFGFVGDIRRVHARPLKRLFKSVNFVAMPCLAATDDGTVCNINADTIATQIAIGALADKLIFMSDVDGVQIKGQTAFVITDKEIEGYIADGTVTDGMQVKMENCKAALDAGVKRIHLINGLTPDALHKEIYESVGAGTMLISEEERTHYMNEVEAQKVIERQAS